jgi:serine/threonine-protein kinase RsbW
MEAVMAFPGAAAAAFPIETALREALANAVLHGCGDDAAQIIECNLSCSPRGEIHIVVRDPGPGFDLVAVPDPLREENVRSNHGRGLYLIRHLMDQVWFERGGAEIHMVLEAKPNHSGDRHVVQG